MVVRTFGLYEILSYLWVYRLEREFLLAKIKPQKLFVSPSINLDDY